MKSEAQEKAEAIAQEILGILNASATSTQWEQMVETIMGDEMVYAYTFLRNEDGYPIDDTFKYWKGNTMEDITEKAFIYYDTHNFHIEESSKFIYDTYTK